MAPPKNFTRLTPEQWQQYQSSGYLSRLPVFDQGGIQKLHEAYEVLKDFPEADADEIPLSFRIWHEPVLQEVVTQSIILNYVEDLLGPNFYVWAARFFVKEPQRRSRVVWHQDSVYWPLQPANCVTVWIAVYDAFKDNAAMQITPGSHRLGNLPHGEVDAGDTMHGSVEIEAGQFDPNEAEYIVLKAGEISIHDSRIIHGSPYNSSDQIRCGLTIRYSAAAVKCDLKIWPKFNAYFVRGYDQHRLNPTWTPQRS